MSRVLWFLIILPSHLMPTYLRIWCIMHVVNNYKVGVHHPCVLTRERVVSHSHCQKVFSIFSTLFEWALLFWYNNLNKRYKQLITYNPQSIGKVWSQKLKWSVVRLEVQTLSAQTLIIVIPFSYRKCLLHHVKLSKISTYSDMSRFRYIICFVLPPTISQDNLPILYSNKYKMRKKMIN